MVDHSAEGGSLDGVFAALADPTRRDIVERLARMSTEAPVAVSISDLAAPYGMSLQAVSKHVRVLERAGLVACGKEGRVRRCHLLPAPLRAADDWLAGYRTFWHDRFEALDAYLLRERGQTDDGQRIEGDEDA